MTTTNDHLVVPALGPIYAGLHDGAETVLRVAAGGLLIAHGAPKIMDPLGATGLVEMIGFAPPAFWSVLLSITEPVAGLLLAIGLLTRPAAVAGTAILLVTVYFHWIVVEEGFQGAQFSILWAAVTAFFAIRGGHAQSVDARLGRAL